VYLAPDTGLWHCFLCGCSGKVKTFNDANALRDRLFGRAKVGGANFESVDMPDFEPLTKYCREWVRRSYQIDDPEKYLLVRGVCKEYNDRVLIPYLSREGEIIYFSSRWGHDLPILGSKYKSMPGKRPLYVPQYAWSRQLERNDLIVLVEGAFDAMSIHSRLGLMAVALGGKALPKHLEHSWKAMVLLMKAQRVCVLLDRDAMKDALKLRHKLAGMLPQQHVYVRICPGSDPASTPTHLLREALD
jgi:hypothetical protein